MGNTWTSRYIGRCTGALWRQRKKNKKEKNRFDINPRKTDEKKEAREKKDARRKSRPITSNGVVRKFDSQQKNADEEEVTEKTNKDENETRTNTKATRWYTRETRPLT